MYKGVCILSIDIKKKTCPKHETRPWCGHADVARTPTVQLFVRTHPGAAPTPGDGEIPQFLDHLDSIVNVYIATVYAKSHVFNRYIHYIWIIYIYTHV